jgi:hypothetical protein
MRLELFVLFLFLEMGATCSARRRNAIACSSSAALALIPHPSLLFRFFFLSPFPFPYSTFYLVADVPLSTEPPLLSTPTPPYPPLSRPARALHARLLSHVMQRCARAGKRRASAGDTG